jgi:hypothetical protein
MRWPYIVGSSYASAIGIQRGRMQYAPTRWIIAYHCISLVLLTIQRRNAPSYPESTRCRSMHSSVSGRIAYALNEINAFQCVGAYCIRPQRNQRIPVCRGVLHTPSTNPSSESLYPKVLDKVRRYFTVCKYTGL